MLSRPAVIQLIGPPAAGKLTVARRIVEQIGDEVLLLDNHTFANPFLALAGSDGVTPAPPAVWDYARAFKASVLEAAAVLTPPAWSFVFTNYWTAVDDGASFARTVDFARRRDSVIVPVVLECSAEELARRVGNEDRRSRSKLVDPVGLRGLLDRGIFLPDHQNVLRLSTETEDPTAVAERILRHVATCGGSGPTGPAGRPEVGAAG